MEGTMNEVTEQKRRSTVTADWGKDTVNNEMRGLQGRLTASVDTKSNKRLFRFMEQSDQLLPGIPDDITLNQIVPKMQWRVFHILSLLSHGWQQAIQSHQVHDARVRAKLTDTFLVIGGNEKIREKIILYSVRDKYYYELPEIPNPRLENEDLESWKWTALDGRLYAIGGLYRAEEGFSGSRKVYVFDLAGQREWKECASMEEGRYDFGCGVMDGRIYVFGGWNGGNPVCGSEVYDTKENNWSAISSEIPWRCDHDVAALGEELVSFNGRAHAPEHAPATAYNDDGSLKTYPYPAWFWDVYHPVKDESRIVRPSWTENRWGTVFMSKGKFFTITQNGLDVRIDVYDYDKKTWSQLHSSSFAGIAGINRESERYDMIVVNDELFIAVCNYDDEPDLLLRSDGFGSDKHELFWRIENGSLPLDQFQFLCTLEL